MIGTLLSIEEWEALALSGPVIGIDEAGRGAWAGPVVVAGAILREDIPADLLAAIRDSKKMTPKRREGVVSWIGEYGTFCLAARSTHYIDAHGIDQAVSACVIDIARKWLESGSAIAALLLDGNRGNWLKVEAGLDALGIPYYCLPKADDLVKVVGAASIIAKVTRDAIMVKANALWPGWGFAHNFGYGTPAHMKALEEHGISQIHRRSYRPLWRWVPVRERLEYRAKRWRGD